MGDMSAQLNCERFGIAALEAAHAIVRQPTPLLRKLLRSVRSLRAHRQMVSVASTQRSSTKNRSHPTAALRLFRVNGLMFLMPGLVSAQLPKAFAIPTAYGDLAAAVLALIALWLVRLEKTAAIPLVWLFNIAGLLDLVYANISTFKDHVDPTYLGVSYYLAAINVPAMVVVHVLIFAYLFRHSRDLSMDATKIKGNRLGV